MNKMIIAVLVLSLTGTFACDDDSCAPCRDPIPPISALSVEVIEYHIYAILMLPDPDPIECPMTLSIGNTSSKHSYSGISIPSAKVYVSSTNQLLGEISFETDWDGTLGPGDVDTVVLTKVMEEAQIFAHPCSEDVYLELLITAGEYGEMQRRTPTDNFSCLF